MGLSDSTTSYYWRGPVSLRSWLQFVFAGRKLLYMYYLVLLNPLIEYIYIRVETLKCRVTPQSGLMRFARGCLASVGFGRPAQWRQPSNADWTAIAARSREALSLHQSPHAGARRALVDEFWGL